MKKIILSLAILLSLSAYSQTMTLINNTSEVIKVEELWTNDFCAYDFPTVQPQVDEAPNASQWVGPFSANTIYSYTGPFMVTSSTHDFEYVQLGIYDPTTSMTVPIFSQPLGTDPTVYYNPASCELPAAPTTTPMTALPFAVVMPGVGPLPPFPGIRQVIRPDVSLTPAPSFFTGGIPGGKIYRMTWLTVFNTGTGKYDVEITIN